MGKTKKSSNATPGLKKFIILLSILALYAVFVIIKFGVKDGLGATFLTWAFFVLCTPIADAGFIVDFPVRLLLGVKMVISEMVVWVVAISITLGYIVFNPGIFNSLSILELFYEVLTNPWPLWAIVFVSAGGTFLSISIGDQIFTLIERHKQHKKIKKLRVKRILLELIAFLFIVLLYSFLLHITHTIIVQG